MKKVFKRIFLDSSSGKVRLNEKVIIFFLCLVIAIFFWYLSSLSKVYSTNFDFALHYSEVSEDLVLIEAPQEKLSLWVSGTGFDLLGKQFSIKKEKLKVDIAKSRGSAASGRYYLLTSTLREDVLEHLSNEITLIDISPDTLFFETMPRISKEVPVLVNHKLTYFKQVGPSGKIVVEPSTVTIYGPSGYIDTLTAIYTDTLFIENIQDSIVRKVKLEYPSYVVGVGSNVDDVQVMIPAEKFTESSIKLPIKLSATSDTTNLKIFPDQVTVTFLVPLSKFELVNEEMFAVEIKFDEEKLLQKKLKVEVVHSPKFVEIIRIRPERVEFIIRK